MPGFQTDHLWQMVVFGSTASCTAEILTCPIDVVKIRLQIQGQSSAAIQKGNTVYKGTIDAGFQIARNEGLSALFKGIEPACIRQWLYGGTRFGAYAVLRDKLATPGQELSFVGKLVSGIGAGLIAASIWNPTDLVKVRMQADQGVGSNKRYKGVFDAFTKIYKEEGLKGMYKGVGPTSQRAALVAGAELSTYDTFKSFLINKNILNDGIHTHFVASLLAGFIATLASSPADVIKTRVMNQPFGPDGKGLLYSSTIDCAKQTVQKEGFFALWKGFVPNFSRLGPHSIIQFLVLEQLISIFVHKN